jgi:hypothetical protein
VMADSVGCPARLPDSTAPARQRQIAKHMAQSGGKHRRQA